MYVIGRFVSHYVPVAILITVHRIVTEQRFCLLFDNKKKSFQSAAR